MKEERKDITISEVDEGRITVESLSGICNWIRLAVRSEYYKDGSRLDLTADEAEQVAKALAGLAQKIRQHEAGVS